MKANSSTVRHISFRTASSFIIASMIGTGVFTSLGYQLVDIQSIFPLLMLWVIGGIISLCGALSYSELGSALPQSGGEYYILNRILHPSIGFSAGVVSGTVGFAAPSVLAAIALGNYLESVFPLIDRTTIAFFAILFFHIVHMKSIRWGKFFQDGSTMIKVFLILIFIVCGFLTENSHSISIMPKIGDGSILLSSSFAISLVWVSYAYTGWNSVIYIAGEIKNPQKSISKVMLFSTSFVMFIYILLNYIFLYTASIDEMVGKIDIGYISGIAIFGELGSKIIGLGISILLLSTISSYVYIGPRIMQAMGEDYRCLSFLKKKDNNIPIIAFIFQLFISVLFLFTSSFEQVLMYAGITLIITTILTVVSLFVFRYNNPLHNRPYKTWGYPFTPLIYIIVNLWILYYSFMEAQFESLIGIGIVLFSILLYFILEKNKMI